MTSRLAALLFAVAASGAALSASASDRERGGAGVGNGGNAVLCYHSTPFLMHAGAFSPLSQSDMGGAPMLPVTVELADYWEHRSGDAAGYKLDLGERGLSYLEKARLVLERLALVDQARAARLLGGLANFSGRLTFVDGDDMPLVRDAKYVIEPAKTCIFRQFAVQFQTAKPGAAKFFIDADLFAAADDDTRTGLVLHELIYEELIESRGEKNSDAVRFFNFMISSTFMRQVLDAGEGGLEDYRRMLERLGLDRR